MASAFERHYDSPPLDGDKVDEEEEQAPRTNRGLVRTSITYAVLFMLIIAGLTGALFWATRNFLPPTDDPTAPSPPTPFIRFQQHNIDPQQLNNPAEFMYDTVAVHPTRQMAMRWRDALVNNQGLAVKVVAGVVFAVLVIAAIVAFFAYLKQPRVIRMITIAERDRLRRERQWSLSYKLKFWGMLLTIAAVIGTFIYILAWRNTSSSVSVTVRRDNAGKKQEARVTLASPGLSHFSTYQGILDALVNNQGLAVGHNLRLFDGGTEEEILLTAAVPSHLVPNLVASPPLAVFYLSNFYVPLDDVDDDGNHSTRDHNVLYVPVPTGTANCTALLQTVPVLLDLVTITDENGAPVDVNADLQFTRLKRKFKVVTRFRLHLVRTDLATPEEQRDIVVPAGAITPAGTNNWVPERLKGSAEERALTELNSVTMTGLQILGGAEPPITAHFHWERVHSATNRERIDVTLPILLKYQSIRLEAVADT